MSETDNTTISPPPPPVDYTSTSDTQPTPPAPQPSEPTNNATPPSPPSLPQSNEPTNTTTSPPPPLPTPPKTETPLSGTSPEWTKDKLIVHLLRPGYKYLNLNPFAVLQLNHTATDEDIKKAYRNMSRFVHPDKNIDDLERSQLAFSAVNQAYKLLTDEEMAPKCRQVIEEAKRRAAENHKPGSKDPISDTAIMNEASKIFVDIEKKRIQLEERDASEKKRKREQEIVVEDKYKKEKEFQENWEKNRDTRVNSWRNFAQKGKKSSSSGVKPPKLKQTR